MAELKTQRMKLDYNHLLEIIDEVMSNSRSKIARENGFGIETGLNMLTSYLKQMAERAIELNDEVLLDLLQDMMIIKKQHYGEAVMEAQRRLEKMNRESERKRLVEILKENCHCKNEDCEKCSSNGICFSYREADHLLDNGIGVKPHCEAGEIVYLVIESPKPQIKTKIIESIVIGILDDKIVFTDGTCFTIWHKDWDLYNNAVFTSREDAEKALKGGADNV